MQEMRPKEIPSSTTAPTLARVNPDDEGGGNHPPSASTSSLSDCGAPKPPPPIAFRSLPLSKQRPTVSSEPGNSGRTRRVGNRQNSSSTCSGRLPSRRKADPNGIAEGEATITPPLHDRRRHQRNRSLRRRSLGHEQSSQSRNDEMTDSSNAQLPASSYVKKSRNARISAKIMSRDRMGHSHNEPTDSPPRKPLPIRRYGLEPLDVEHQRGRRCQEDWDYSYSSSHGGSVPSPRLEGLESESADNSSWSSQTVTISSASSAAASLTNSAKGEQDAESRNSDSRSTAFTNTFGRIANKSLSKSPSSRLLRWSSPSPYPPRTEGGCISPPNRTLFKNFDKNWPRSDSDLVGVVKERMCLASMACVFEGMPSFPYRPIVGIEIDGEDRGRARTKDDVNVAKGTFCPAVPREVLKLFWSTVVMPSLSLDESEGAKEGNDVGATAAKITGSIDVIVESLASELSYLTLRTVEGVECLEISHGLYQEYGRHILEIHCASVADLKLKDVTTQWHAAFAKVLHQELLCKEQSDLVVSEYAAMATPNHLLLAFPSFEKDETMEAAGELLADDSFLRARMAVLGHNDLNGSNGDDLQVHALHATNIHIKDIEAYLHLLSRQGLSSLALEKAAVTLYDAWKMQIIYSLHRVHLGYDYEGAPKELTEDSSDVVTKEIKGGSNGWRSKAGSVQGGEDAAVVLALRPAKGDALEGGDTAQEGPATEDLPSDIKNSSQITDEGDDAKGKVAEKEQKPSRKSRIKRQSRIIECSPSLKLSGLAVLPQEGQYDEGSIDGSTLSVSDVSDDEGRTPTDGVVPEGQCHRRYAVSLGEVLEMRISKLKAEACIGRTFFILAQSVGRFAATGGDDRVGTTAFSLSRTCHVDFVMENSLDLFKLQASLMSLSIETYSEVRRALSYVSSSDMDMLLAGLRTDPDFMSADASLLTALERFVSERAEMRQLMNTIKVVLGESWFELGLCLRQLDAHASSCGEGGGSQTSEDDNDIDLDHLCGLYFSTTVVGEDGEGNVDRQLMTVAESDPLSGGRTDGDSSDGGSSTSRKRNAKPGRHIRCHDQALLLLALAEPPHGALHRPHQAKGEVESHAIRLYRISLHASVLHEVGEIYSKRRRAEVAIRFLSEAVGMKREILASLHSDAASGGDMMGRKQRRGASPRSVLAPESACDSSVSDKSLAGDASSEEISPNAHTRKLCLASILLETPRGNYSPKAKAMTLEGQVAKAEESLSVSIASAALTLHSIGKSERAVDLLREALVLRTSQVGRDSINTADLHGAIGLVHDDLGHWGESLKRHGEALRLREQHFLLILRSSRDKRCCKSKAVPGNATDDRRARAIENDVLSSLRSMGNAHRLLGNYNSAMECYSRIAEIFRSRWNELCSSGNGGDASLQAVPLPILVLDEHRQKKQGGKGAYDANRERSALSSAGIHHQGTMAKYSTFFPLITAHGQAGARGGSAEEDTVLKEAADVHSTIIVLLQEKASHEDAKTANGRATETKKWSSDSVDADQAALLKSSYRLGLIYMHFQEYRSAITSLEQSLRALWLLDPCYTSSSGSEDESISSSRLRHSGKASRRHQREGMRGTNSGDEDDVVDEGELYRALGVSHAALGQHERALRCHLTALRYARKAYGMVSLKVAEILHDAGTSYWYVGEFQTAGEFWGDCLRILLHYSDGCGAKGWNGNRKRETIKAEIGRVLYNLASSHCAMGRCSSSVTLACLEDAHSIFSESRTDGMGVAHTTFYLGLAHYIRACNMPELAKRKKRKTLAPETIACVVHKNGSDAHDNKNGTESIEQQGQKVEKTLPWDETLNLAMDYFGKASEMYNSFLNSASTTGGQLRAFNDQGRTERSKITDLLQAHISFLQGSILDDQGLRDLALGSYAHSLRLYKSHGDDGSLHAAAVLHKMASLLCNLPGSEDRSLRCYKESLQLRYDILGQDHESVATILHDMANLCSRKHCHSQTMDMFAEALRIRVLLEGRDGESVAQTLLCMGVLNAQCGRYNKAIECLRGAVNVRKNRVMLLEAALGTAKGDLAGTEQSVKRDKTFDIIRLSDILMEEKQELAVAQHNMGNVHLKKGELESSIFCYNKTLELMNLNTAACTHSDAIGTECNKMKDSETSLCVADTLHNLGFANDLSGRDEKALECYSQSLELKATLFLLDGTLVDCEEGDKLVTLQTARWVLNQISCDNPKGNISYAATLYRIGRVHFKLHNHETALSCYESALHIQRAQLGSDHILVARTLSDMGHLLRQMNSKHDVAGWCYNEAMRIRKLKLGDNHEAVGSALYDVGTIYDLQKDYKRAVRCYRQALGIYGQNYVQVLGQQICKGIMAQRRGLASSLTASHPKDNESWDGRFSVDLGISTCPRETNFDLGTRENIMRVSGAMCTAYQNSSGDLDPLFALDMHASQCLISMQALLYRVLEYVSKYFVEPVQYSWRLIVNPTAGQMQITRSNSAVIAHDTATFQMLFLIQE